MNATPEPIDEGYTQPRPTIRPRRTAWSIATSTKTKDDCTYLREKCIGRNVKLRGLPTLEIVEVRYDEVLLTSDWGEVFSLSPQRVRGGLSRA